MNKTFRLFMLSVDFGLSSGDEDGLLDFLEDYGLREDFGACPEEFYRFFDEFDQLVEWRDKIFYLRREVKRLLA